MSKSAASPSGPEMAAVRKVIYQLAEMDGKEVDPTETSMIDAANQALENVGDLADRVEQLEATVEVLEERAPSPSEKSYEQMDKPDKATVVREKMKKTAENTNGRAAMTYKDVMAVFDGRPSAGHAYDIMEYAGDSDGFDYGSSPAGEKRLTVNLGKIAE